ncbi:TerB family tellurite resistance protein [Candidatus Pelagibacter sp.]|nr:TerB family tellurite resistance protein [Candidatus Pelagibacter sp.]
MSKIIKEAKIIEENSNQILDFTKEVKNLPEDDKIKIIEALWSIIYSNKDADIYETNLMRRLAGLLYVDSKTMGDIKERIRNLNS